MRELAMLRSLRTLPERVRLVARAVFETRDHLERSRADVSAQIKSCRVTQHAETALVREILRVDLRP